MRTLPLHAWVLLAAHSAAQELPSEAPSKRLPSTRSGGASAARHPDLRAGYCEPRRAQNLQLGRAGGSSTHGYDEGRHAECHSWDTECYLTRYPDIYEGARVLRLPRTVPRSHDGSCARSFCHSTVSGMYEVRVVRILEHMAVAGQEEGRDESACATSAPLPPSEGSRLLWRAADAARSARTGICAATLRAPICSRASARATSSRATGPASLSTGRSMGPPTAGRGAARRRPTWSRQTCWAAAGRQCGGGGGGRR